MADTKKNETPVEEINPYDDKVLVNIAPPTEADEENGEYVSVNGYNAYIAYGEDVIVPRFVLHVLENRKLAIKDLKKNEKKRNEKK